VHNEQALAARAVLDVLRGTTLADALGSSAPSDPRQGRAFVQELAYGTLRHFGTLRAIARDLAARPFTDPALEALVAVALYQLDHGRSPAFAVVDRAVDAASLVARPAAKRMVNAMLRRYLRERDAVRAHAMRDPVARYSHPRWWIDRVRRDWPDRWQRILAAGNSRPPLTLRANVRVTERDALVARLTADGIAASAIGATGVIVEPPRPVTSLPGFAEGAFAVQDAGAQLAAPLVDAGDGMRVLDACAAPGGKTTHLAELADCAIVALDRDVARLSRVRDNVERLRHSGRDIAIVVGDAADPDAWWDRRAFDRILVDAPCTASGIVRRRPDAKWLRRLADVETAVAEQVRILDSLWPLVARGGKLVYATCSVFVAENEAQAEAFAGRHHDALRETLTFAPEIDAIGGQLLPSAEGGGQNQDGFFYARFRKA
jgi:16S rRNA (cytosine967-C5)-methyltransferase